MKKKKGKYNKLIFIAMVSVSLGMILKYINPYFEIVAIPGIILMIWVLYRNYVEN